MKKLFFLIILLANYSLLAESNKQPPKFLNYEQRVSFYQQMVSEIERLDAEIIETRNHSKAIKWDQFKEYYKDKIVNAKDWEQLSLAFKHFSQGLVNLHTKTKFLAYDQKPQKRLWLNDDIVFEYPAKRLYLKSNRSEITHLNNTPISQALSDFSNYRCRHNNEAGCVDMFSLYLKAGAIKVDNKNIVEFKTIAQDGSIKIVSADFNSEPIPSPDPFADDYCSTHQGYKDFDLIFSGKNVCLYQKMNTAVLRIRHFKYQDQNDSDIYCDKQEGDFCHDIQGLLEQLHRHKPSHLVFDVIQNFGGNENTKFLAAFMPNYFTDLSVMYRNTVEIHDKDIRNGLLWGNPLAEQWYQDVKEYKGDYLPIRGDFCRGKNGCNLSMIEPHKNAYKAETISIMTDWMCVSSCDDFVWRMQQFANAKLYGITPAQDATYARARILIYLDKNGQVKTKASAEMYSFYLDNVDFKIAEIILPYSKTVTLDGKLRNIQGLPVKQIPYTLDNYDRYPQAVLETILD